MRGRVLILGSTDLTTGAAAAVLAAGLDVAAVVHGAETFTISYAKEPVRNARWADIPAWCAARGVRSVPYTDWTALAALAAETEAGVCLVAGWYHMVPARFRRAFKGPTLGLHASLLPELRGGAPLNWAILKGLSRTGVTLFELGDGVDDGPVYDQEAFEIGARTTVADLVAASQAASATILVRALPAIASGALHPRPQKGAASYGLQRRPEDGRIHWTLPVEAIDRLVRAVRRPYPGALATLEGAEIVVHGGRPFEGPPVFGAPGQIAIIPDTAHPLVVCGEGVYAIEEAELKDGSDALPMLRKANHRRFAP